MGYFKNISIKKLLSIIIFFSILIPIILTNILFFNKFKDTFKNFHRSKIIHQTKSLNNSLNEYLYNYDIILNVIERQEVLEDFHFINKTMTQEEIKSFYTNLSDLNNKKYIDDFKNLKDLITDFEENENIKTIYLGTPKKVLFGNDSGENSLLINNIDSDFDCTTREWYIGAVKNKGKTYWSLPYTDRIVSKDNKTILSGSRAIYTSDNQLIGVVSIDILVDQFISVINEFKMEKQYNSFIINKDGKYIFSNLNNLGETTKNKEVIDFLSNDNTLFQFNSKVYTKLLNEKSNWFIVQSYSIEDVNSNMIQLLTSIWVYGLIIIISILIITYMAAGIFLKPIYTLTTHFKNMKDKDGMETSLDPKMIQRKNEIGALFNSVNQMQTKILDSFKIIEYFNFHDPLTNLYNRRYYENNLNKLDIPKNYPLTIVVSDINGLKLINDAFGHGEGDRVLISTANIISNSCRKTDLIARTGGDEFVIIMPNTNESTTEKIIDEINEQMKKINVNSIKLSISFGFKTKNNIDEDICKIYKTAEDLMYREKLLVIPSMRSGAIEAILNALHEKDKSSEIHSRTVSKISEKIALACKMNRQDVSEIKTAGLLHDIGKIMIPIEILLKKGKLTNEEYSIIKKHSEIGFRILNSNQNMSNIANIVLSHHERWDGLGYPRGIKGYDIPLQSRIISIADTFDAMTSKRTYQKTCSNEDALAEIVRCSGTQFDPELVKIFKDNFHMIIKEKV